MKCYTFLIASLFCFFIIFSETLTAKPARSTEPKLLDSFGKWKVWSLVEEEGEIYFMSSEPINQKFETKSKRSIMRGRAYMLITHRPWQKSFNVVSFDVGYTFSSKKEEKPKVIIDNRITFQLDPGKGNKEIAWVKCNTEKECQIKDKRLTKTIIEGKKLKIIGFSSRGTKTIDTYSLTGSYKAFQLMCKKARYRYK